MKKLLAAVLAGIMLLGTACNPGTTDETTTAAAATTTTADVTTEDDGTDAPETDDTETETPGIEETEDPGTEGTETDGVTEEPSDTEEPSSETPSGDGITIEGEIENGRFLETRKISVEIYDRGNDGGTAPEDNVFTDFIKQGMLEKHNVEVEYVPVPRWTEVEQLNNLLAANDAPDIAVTYDYPTILAFANMGGVLDLSEYVEEYKDGLPNLWGWLGETNIYWDRDPVEGTLWALEAKLAHNTRINTFVRQDWLETLGLDKPASREAFEAMLVAFEENAETLLGEDAASIVPFSMSYDIGWRGDHLHASFTDPDITERDRYIYGFDDRRLLYPGYKDSIRQLNEWYNMGLMWDDFAIYGAGDETEDNMMKAGYVGSFMHNWDYPYRNGDDSINNSLKRLVGEDAGYVTIQPFENAAGEYRKFLPGPIDRKVFFPATNDEPLASLLYLDWISTLENRMYLQIGEEGTNHNVTDEGFIEIMPATGDWIMNSPSNIDYTITINGLDLGDADKTIGSIALGYPGVEPEVIATAYEMTMNDAIYGRNVNVGEITSEAGMGPSLAEKRDVLLTQSLVADPADFDSVFDSGLQDYLNSGGQAIIDERTAKWEAAFGDATEQP